MHDAAVHQLRETCLELLKHGANPRLLNAENNSAAMLARCSSKVLAKDIKAHEITLMGLCVKVIGDNEALLASTQNPEVTPAAIGASVANMLFQFQKERERATEINAKLKETFDKKYEDTLKCFEKLGFGGI